jgi:hypothetical protein
MAEIHTTMPMIARDSFISGLCATSLMDRLTAETMLSVRRQRQPSAIVQSNAQSTTPAAT